MNFQLSAVLACFSFCVIATDVTPKIPEEVSKFTEQRDSCDHFRGEPPYNEERKVFLNIMITELCVGTDEQLNLLKLKYKDNSDIIKLLTKYEVNIEE